MNRKQSVLTVFLALSLSACIGPEPPPCPYRDQVARAQSAGCFVYGDDGMLVVIGRQKKISPPGGASSGGEPAQCTAFRETWEETGLIVDVHERLATFDTGFYLYRCEVAQRSGPIAPPRPTEIERAFYMPVEEFDQWEWRFSGQQSVMKSLARSMTARD